MKIVNFIVLSFFFITQNALHAMEPNKSNQTSPYPQLISSITSGTMTLAALLFEILNFNPQEENFNTKQKQLVKTKISESLTIVAPSKVSVKKQGHHLLVNGDYYDPNLKGKLYWKKGQLINKKGAVKNPLL